MEIDKVITYSAIGVAGIVCLVFLLDLTAGIFGRQVAMDILFILGSAFFCGRVSRPCWNSASQLARPSFAQCSKPKTGISKLESPG